MVDETTPANPSEEKGRRRIEEEDWLQTGPWETLVLRPAAIYGPGRGVHLRVKENRPPRAEPAGITSRIHVDDLASLVEAGALSNLTGAWPVAERLSLPDRRSGSLVRRAAAQRYRHALAGPNSAAGRKVDGRKLGELLDTELRYPEYRSGILASLAEETPGRSPAAGRKP